MSSSCVRACMHAAVRVVGGGVGDGSRHRVCVCALWWEVVVVMAVVVVVIFMVVVVVVGRWPSSSFTVVIISVCCCGLLPGESARVSS